MLWLKLTLLALAMSTTQSSLQYAQTTNSDLADHFAPMIMHPGDEPNWPANVNWFLPKTHLRFHNANCARDDKDFGIATVALLAAATVSSSCTSAVISAEGTRSADRTMTFLLSDVDDRYKSGPSDPNEWITYFHVYDNDSKGKTIQYWIFYPYNTGVNALGVKLGYHGGDWEMVSVVLSSGMLPIRVSFTGHNAIEGTDWTNVQKVGNHPVVYAERGGHEMHAAPPTNSKEYIKHPTWSGSSVVFPGGLTLISGALVDMGTKLHPNLNWVTYSGLWGNLGVLPYSSGYWGPAFNETGMPHSQFLQAWCDGISDPNESVGGKKECYPDDPR